MPKGVYKRPGAHPAPIHFLRHKAEYASFYIKGKGTMEMGKGQKPSYWMVFPDGFPNFLRIPANCWEGKYNNEQLWAPFSRYGKIAAQWLRYKDTPGSVFDVPAMDMDVVQGEVVKSLESSFRDPRWRAEDPWYCHRRAVWKQAKAGGEFSTFRLGGADDYSQINTRREKELARVLTSFITTVPPELSAIEKLARVGADALACARLGWYLGDRSKLGGINLTRTNIGIARFVEMLFRAGFTTNEIERIILHKRDALYELLVFPLSVQKRLAFLASYYQNLCKQARIERAYSNLVCSPSLSEWMSVQTEQPVLLNEARKEPQVSSPSAVLST